MTIVNTNNRWGVILAGGDGRRLLSYTREITGDDRPKQFCAIVGGQTLLNQTRWRVSKVIPIQQTLLMLTRTHEPFFRNEIADIPTDCQLVQPYNHGTAQAILFSLMRLRQMDPAALVAFFPSDHYLTNNQAFTDCLDRAYEFVEANSGKVALLGIEADAPETSYGWIEPGAMMDRAASISAVSRFWEKPSSRIAKKLMRKGCLWNSFVMVGSVSSFLNLYQHAAPDLFEHFDSHRESFHTENEELAIQRIYVTTKARNFSEEVLAKFPEELAVIEARDLGWSDLGEPQRVIAVLNRRQTETSMFHRELALAAMGD